MTDIPNRGQKPPIGFIRREASVNGTRTVFYIGGEGPPLLFWHGAGTFHGIDFARQWTRQYSVILPFHPGFGETADDPGFDTMGSYLAHYEGFLEMLGERRVHLGGISMGGWMAAEFALRRPEMVDRLVLVAPAGIADADVPVPDLGAIPPDELLSYLAHNPSVFEPYLPKSDAEAQEFNAMLAGEGQTLAKLLPNGPFRDGLAADARRITAPTLLLWGRQDRILPVALAETWQRALPNVQLQLFDNAGHTLLDESAEARQAVVEFLG
jgi:pimeloyl-ACP methyl ester carboxylesterase